MMPGQDQELIHLLALLRIRQSGQSYADVAELVADDGGAVNAWNNLAEFTLFPEPSLIEALKVATSDLASWRERGYTTTAFTEEHYPVQLREVHEMPPIIWTRGKLETKDQGVSVVGTRKPSEWALEYTDAVAKGLVAAGITVVSGLASGIDTQAHKSALDAGGRTVAVLGCGLDHSYPPENSRLQERIANTGLLLSQFSPAMGPTSHSFPMRNAVMSGYSRVTLIVEAGEHSGTRIQGRVAVAHGRAVILTNRIVEATEWGVALAKRPGVFVASTSDEALSLAISMSDPLPGTGVALLQQLLHA
jgi:DNA processing protein